METSQSNSNGSKEKVLAWVEEIKNDNPSVFPLLSEQYLPLMHKLLSGFHFNHYEWEDLYQECLYALYKAALTYDSAKEANFTTYATSCIRHRLIDLLRHQESTTATSVPWGSHPEDKVFTTLQSPDDEELKHLLREMKDILSPYEHQVLLLYLTGYRYEEIAQQFNTTEKSVDNALQRGRSKLRRFRPQ